MSPTGALDKRKDLSAMLSRSKVKPDQCNCVKAETYESIAPPQYLHKRATIILKHPVVWVVFLGSPGRLRSFLLVVASNKKNSYMRSYNRERTFVVRQKY